MTENPAFPKSLIKLTLVCNYNRKNRKVPKSFSLTFPEDFFFCHLMPFYKKDVFEAKHFLATTGTLW